MSPSHPLTRFAQKASAFEQLPPDVVSVAKEVMVNAAAVGLAGAAQQEGQTLTRFVQDMGGNGRCTIIGKGLRTSPVYAALVNGALIHLLDFDDEIIATGSHPASVVFPVVMALGEMNGLAGRDVLAAFVLGCETISQLRAGRQIDGDRANVCGATAAAGRLLGLDAEQLEQALGLAAGGITGTTRREGHLTPVGNLAAQAESFGTWPLPAAAGAAGPGRAYHQGQAAMHGTMAAMLAQQGLAVLAGDVPQLWPGGADRANGGLAAGWGNPYHCISPGASLKLYPCASAAHTAIDAALQLAQQYRIRAEDLVAVRVNVTAAALEALPHSTPANGWQARSCLSYIVAAALTYGQPLIDNFTDGAVADARVRELMDRITVDAAEESSHAIPWPCSLSVTLKNGRQLGHRVEFARGQPELPLSPEELDAKFLYCSRYILPPDHIEEAITRLRDLENIENTTGLFSVLGG